MGEGFKHHVAEHVLKARRAKHCVLACMVLGALAAACGYEFLAIAAGWATNLIWIYET